MAFVISRYASIYNFSLFNFYSFPEQFFMTLGLIGLTNYHHLYWADPLFVSELGAHPDLVSYQFSAKSCPSLLSKEEPLDESTCDFIAQESKDDPPL